MLTLLFKIYRYFFARECFVWFNKFLYRLGLSGLGILNYENEKLSGEAFFLRSYLKNITSGVVLDVGSNIGNYSKAVMKINPALQVHAFEPHPKTFQKMIDLVSAQNFFPINSAVGEDECFISLYDYESEDGSSHASLYKTVIENIHKSKSVEHEVRMVKLSNYLKQKNIERVVLLKIDTEGHELAVLRGLGSYIEMEKIEVIHFEFNEMNIASRIFFKDFNDILNKYEFYRLLPYGMLKIKQYNPLYCEIFAYQNIVAILKSGSQIACGV